MSFRVPNLPVEPTSMLFSSIGVVAILVGYASVMQTLAGPKRETGRIPWKTPQLAFGILLFVLGFGLFSYMLLCGQNKSTKVILLVALIVLLLCEGTELRRLDTDPNAPGHKGKQPSVAIVEAIAILAVGVYVAGQTAAPTAKATGAIAGALVVLAGGYTLPRARAAGEADSSGYVGLTVGMLLVCLLNSSRPHSLPSKMPKWLNDVQAAIERVQQGGGKLLSGPVLEAPQRTASMVGDFPPVQMGASSMSTPLF